ncbi:MAG: DUF4124 domain-containing protein [Kangiellaceae bacterium]|nr:DUF4124 domain-containing protein [Kangiellaceae bacterium]
MNLSGVFSKLALLAAFAIATNIGTLSANETVMYKKVDKNGRVIYTDKPIPGAKPITVKTNTNVISTSKPVVTQKLKLEEEKEETFEYSVLSIDKPSNDEAIRANDGNLYVIVGISPQLQPNHSVRLQMDGIAIGQAQKVPYFSLSNVDRGTHKLTAVIIDDDSQKILKTSEASSFHMLRATVLNNPVNRN